MAMPIDTRRSRWLIAVLALIGVGILAGAAIAVAGAKHGGSYSGTTKQGPVGISFQVSGSGKKVKHITASTFPLFCQGGGPPSQIIIKNAKIKNNKFTTTGKEINGNDVLATATLTGKFTSSTKEKGKLKVDYLKAPTCSGKTTYSTTFIPPGTQG